jgi:hypothetical protein
VHDDAVNTAEFDSAPDGGSFPELQLRILANVSSSLLRVDLGMNLDWVPIHSLLMTSSSIKESTPQFWRLLYSLAKLPTCPHVVQVTNGRDYLLEPITCLEW